MGSMKIMENRVTGNAVIKKLDSFWCAPKYMNHVRQFYKDILIEIAKSYLLEDIVSQLVGEPTKLTYTHPELWREMEDAEYMLS